MEESGVLPPSGGWEEEAEAAPSDPTSDVNLNLEDCMDMVVSYRCKFCSFTSTVPQAIRSHVAKVHISRTVSLSSKSDVQETSLRESSNVNSSQNLDSLQVELNNSRQDHSEQFSTMLVSAANEQNAAVTSIIEDQPLSTELQMTGEIVAKKIESLTDKSVRHKIVIKEESNALHRGLDIIPATSGETKESLTSSTVDAMTETAVVVEEMAEGELHLEGGAVTDGVVNKELFLCGQCNLGFNSIEECKTHMIDDHNLNMDGVGEDDEVVLPPNCTSVGTQVTVTRKKPGRKRKGEKPPEGNLEEKGLDSEEETIEVFETSSKRKVRPPRGLTQLYYLTKTKRSTRTIPKFPRERYKLTCPRVGCGARFATSSSLEVHKSCHISHTLTDTKGAEAVFLFLCTHCKHSFPTWKPLRLHLWRQHSVDTDLYCCPECGFRTDSTHKMTIHMEIHGEERPYACDVCGKGFKQMNQMRTHRLIHGDRSVLENPAWYSNRQCEICKRIFASRKCLQKHVQAVHGDEKPFTCPYCTHASSRKAMMDLHIRTHTGEKPFKCDHCAFATGDHNSLRRHKMRHTGQKPYKCQYCTYSCIQAISLKTHMKNKHPGCEGIFSCSLCQYKTVNELFFKNHTQDHEVGLIPTLPPGEKNEQSPKRVRRSVEKLEQKEGKLINIQEVPNFISGNENMSTTVQIKDGKAELLETVPNTGGVNTTDLIYSALHAIKQQTESGNTMEVDMSDLELNPGGLHPSVSTSTQDGVTTHTITFHIPPGTQAGQDGAATSTPLVLTVQPVASVTGEGGSAQYNENVSSHQFVDVLQVDNMTEIPGAHIVEIPQCDVGQEQVISEGQISSTSTQGQILPVSVQEIGRASTSMQNISSNFHHMINTDPKATFQVQQIPTSVVEGSTFHTAQVIQTFHMHSSEIGGTLIQDGTETMTSVDGDQTQNLVILQSEMTESKAAEIVNTESVHDVEHST